MRLNYHEIPSLQVGDYIGMGLVGLVALLGFIAMGYQLTAELRGKRAQPPPIPAAQPPPPRGSRARRATTNEKITDKY